VKWGRKAMDLSSIQIAKLPKAFTSAVYYFKNILGGCRETRKIDYFIRRFSSDHWAIYNFFGRKST
jgi:hypothetical protein